MENLTQEEMQYYEHYFSMREGRKQPCSNQIVLCGLVMPKEKARDLMKEYKQIRTNEWFYNEELWRLIPMNYASRGYRFYKVWIDKDINKQFFRQVIMPLCAMYCCEMKFV